MEEGWDGAATPPCARGPSRGRTALTLYARVTLALMGAAAGGATALVVAATADLAPATTWSLLLGGMLGLAACLARWVMRPLRRLVADMEEGDPPPVDRTLAHLRHAFTSLRGRLAEREAAVEAQVTERVRDLVVTQGGLTLLFEAVTGDAPETPDGDFASALLSRWVREGPVRAAGVWWHDAALPVFLSAGDEPLHPDQVPHGLLDALAHASHPVVAVHGPLAWLAVAVPADPGPGPARSGPRALVAAWPADRPPAESERLACTALARYLATRSAAHRARRAAAREVTPSTPAVTPMAPARHPVPAASENGPGRDRSGHP
jgi:hypothetical protein